MNIFKNVFYTMTYTVTQHKLSQKMTPKPLSQKMTCFCKSKNDLVHQVKNEEVLKLGKSPKSTYTEYENF